VNKQKPVAWVYVCDGDQFADNFPSYAFCGIERLPPGNHHLYVSPPVDTEEVQALKARVAELEQELENQMDYREQPR
jgi:hypothetical protein